jgi:hypothetical protein
MKKIPFVKMNLRQDIEAFLRKVNARYAGPSRRAYIDDDDDDAARAFIAIGNATMNFLDNAKAARAQRAATTRRKP